MDELVAKGEQELADLVEQVPEEVLDYIVDLEERVEKAEDAVSDTEPEPVDAFQKAMAELPTEVAKAFEDQRSRLETAEAVVQTQQVEKADAVWVAKARAVDGLIDDPEDFGKELRAVATANPKLAESIMSKLTVAAERFEKAGLFTESGHSLVAAGSAAEKITNIAKAATEADPAKSQAQAETEAWEANPDLYDEHVAEQRTRTASKS